MSETKPTIVKINRFYRPRGLVGAQTAILSDRGVTVMFTLDYANEEFVARYAVCNGDNFDRAIGIAYAQACPTPVYGKLVRGAKLYDLLTTQLSKSLTSPTTVLRSKVRRDIARLYSELVDCKTTR